jgi:NAD(P)H-dependent FMN reductase
MTPSNVVLGLIGSPNREGRTNRLVQAALDGAAAAGAPVEVIQMADCRVGPCQDCLPWVCNTNLRCTYDDPGFELLSKKILDCGALILGTPVYWWDTSALVKFLILKMFRVYARTQPIAGLPALGIGIAGGTGNGLVSGLRPVYHFFQMLQMRPLAPLPSTRFDFDAALEQARLAGTTLAGLAGKRQPFSGREELLLHYDSLPYINLSRADERWLLADLTTNALLKSDAPNIASGLAQAGALLAAGKPLESQKEVTRVYEAGFEIFNK